MATTTKADGTAEGNKSGKALVMVQLTEDINRRIVEAAAERKISKNRWITELVAKEFGVTLPEPQRKASGLRARFELANPRLDNESDSEYDARYKAFKDAEAKTAREAHAAKTKQALSLLETLQAAQEKGEAIDVAALLEQLKAS